MSARILVVDDVEVNVKLLEAKLSSEYFNVLTANDGQTALQIAQDERPDLILLDVMMPRMDGFETCKRLKADPRTAEIPVVMVTALTETADRVRGLEAGADDFLSKPVNDVALFARVRSLVRLRRMMDEWRHREAVYGQFNALFEKEQPVEDKRPARILLWEENAFAGARIAEMLAPIATETIRPSCSGWPRGLTSAPPTICCARSIATNSPRAPAPASAASASRIACRRTTRRASPWRSPMASPGSTIAATCRLISKACCRTSPKARWARRWSCSTSISSSGSTTATATPPAMRFYARFRPASAATCAPSTWWRAMAARNSSSCCPRRRSPWPS